MNLPNKLTILRIALIPIFMVFVLPFPSWVINNSWLLSIQPQLIYINSFIYNYGNYVAAAFFIIASITDGLDGYFARKRKQITRFGQFLDPIADKLLVTAALVALVARDEVTGWAATIIIGREFLVTGLRLVAAADGIIITASQLGKIKTVSQMVAIIAALIKNYPIKFFVDFPFDRYAMFIAVFITIYSGYDYISKNYSVLQLDKQ